MKYHLIAATASIFFILIVSGSVVIVVDTTEFDTAVESDIWFPKSTMEPGEASVIKPPYPKNFVGVPIDPPVGLSEEDCIRCAVKEIQDAYYYSRTAQHALDRIEEKIQEVNQDGVD